MNTLTPFLEEPYPGIDLLIGSPSILTIKEAAAVCNVSVQTIQRMIEADILPVNCDGEIVKADLVAYIKSHTLADKPLL